MTTGDVDQSMVPVLMDVATYMDGHPQTHLKEITRQDGNRPPGHRLRRQLQEQTFQLQGGPAGAPWQGMVDVGVAELACASDEKLRHELIALMGVLGCWVMDLDRRTGQ